MVIDTGNEKELQLTVHSHCKERTAPRRVGGVQRGLPGPYQHPHRERPGRVRMLRREEAKLIRISLVYWLCALYDIMPGVCGCFYPKRESRVVVICVPG